MIRQRFDAAGAACVYSEKISFFIGKASACFVYYTDIPVLRRRVWSD